MSAPTGPSSQPSTCLLLALPPELQTEIFRFALHDQDTKDLTYGSYKPGLLTTCRQIRTDVRSIYYLEIRFELAVRHYDSSVLVKLLELGNSVRCGSREMEAKVFVSNEPDWGNLAVWLYRFHVNEINRGTMCDEDEKTPENETRHAMLSLVGMMPGKLWAKVERTLTPLYLILVAIDARWKTRRRRYMGQR